MKVRQGFVSNSSSSSFIVIDKKPNYPHIELSKKQAGKIIHYIENRKNDPIKTNWRKENVYLTPFVCDGNDDYGDFLHFPKAYIYCNGGHGVPYFIEDFYEVAYNIWIMKQHYIEEGFVAGLAIIQENEIEDFPIDNVFQYNYPSFYPKPIIEYLGEENNKLELHLNTGKVSIKVNDMDFVAWIWSKKSPESMRIYNKIKEYNGKVIIGKKR